MQAIAKLRDLSVAPRKVRLVAALIRGTSATKGLAILKHVPKKCAVHLEKLLIAAISNWEHKNEHESLENASLYIKAVWVDGAGMLKRLRPAPQGRGHRIRKRASHITLIVDNATPAAPVSNNKQEDSVSKTQQKKDTTTNGEKS